MPPVDTGATSAAAGTPVMAEDATKISDEVLTADVRQLLSGGVEGWTLKKVMKALGERHGGCDLAPRKKVVQAAIDAVLNEQAGDDSDDDKKESSSSSSEEAEGKKESEEEEEGEGEGPATKKAKKDTAGKKAPTAKSPSKSTPSPRGRKTVCNLTRKAFLAKAPPMKLTLDLGKAGQHSLTAAPREFSSGSFGYYLNGKFPATIIKEEVTLNVGCNIIVVGSKELD